MKKPVLILLITSLVLVAGLVTAGCTQSSSTDVSQSAGNQAPGSADGSGTPAAGLGSDWQNGGHPGNYAGGNASHQSRGPGQGFMNETRISNAAVTLGISEDALTTALNSTASSSMGRPDLTAAAQQLGITEQQLTDAFGFPAAGGFGNGTPVRGNWSGAPGKETGGQQPPQGQPQ